MRGMLPMIAFWTALSAARLLAADERPKAIDFSHDIAQVPHQRQVGGSGLA
jgi:hypothetical protein